MNQTPHGPNQYRVPPQPFVQYQTAAHPFPTAGPPQVATPPHRTVSERLSAAVESGLVGRVLAGVGVAITLSGIVMLLILAAQAGLLRPEIRVAGGGALAAALTVLGLRIGRDRAKRSGAVALVATGIAGLLFDVLAATVLYHWLPAPAGLAVAGVVAGAGVGVAHRWNDRALAAMTSIAMLALAPVLTGGVTTALVAFMLVYVAATAWVQIGRDWTELFLINAAGVTIPAALLAVDGAQPWIATGFAAAGTLFTLGSAVLLARSTTTPEALALGSAATAVALLPAMAALGAIAFPVVAAVAVCFGAAAFGTASTMPFPARAVWMTAAAMLLLIGAGYLGGDAYRSPIMIAIGLVLAGSSILAGEFALTFRIAATAFVTIGLLLTMGFGAWAQLFAAEPVLPNGQVSILTGALTGVVAVAVLTKAWADAHPAESVHIVVAGGLVLLWLITTVSLSAAHLITADHDAAFVSGHAVATVVWGACATAALVVARRPQTAKRGLILAAGLGVMAAAIAKLFLFDLAALDGVFRVIAFMVVGLLLLGLGVSYAQSLGTGAAGNAERERPAV